VLLCLLKMFGVDMQMLATKTKTSNKQPVLTIASESDNAVWCIDSDNEARQMNGSALGLQQMHNRQSVSHEGFLFSSRLFLAPQMCFPLCIGSSAFLQTVSFGG